MLEFQSTNVLGETRAIQHIYSWDEDGRHYAAYDCPFCTSAVSNQHSIACENPGCSANPAMPVDAALKQKADTEKRAREEQERKRKRFERTARRCSLFKRTRIRRGCGRRWPITSYYSVSPVIMR